MATEASGIRDDRVLPYTRGPSLFITPFLVVAFVLPGSAYLWDTVEIRPRRDSADELKTT